MSRSSRQPTKRKPAKRPIDVTPTPDQRYRRIVFGISAIVCLLLAPVFAHSRGWSHMLPAGLVRIGIVSGAAWLALPQLDRLTGRARRKGGLVVLGIVVVLLALRPRVFAPLLLALVVLTWWRKRSGRTRA